MPEGRTAACSNRCRAELSRLRRVVILKTDYDDRMTRLAFLKGDLRRLNNLLAAAIEQARELGRAMEGRE